MELALWKERIDGWFADKEPEMLALLERLVNMDSFTSDGDDVNRVGEVISEWMRNAGFHTAKIAKAPIPADEPWMAALGNVFTARTHPIEAGPGIAFLSHMDTVFPAGTAAARPFRLDRTADRATGPGVTDMKAGLVQNMFVARALKELDLIRVPMTLTFSPDEELGSPSTTPVLGEQLNGAVAAICSEPGYANGGVTLERKGSGHMLLEIKGKAAHAGRCYEDGASSILELAHKVLAFDRYVDLPNETTVNTGLVSGGTSANSVAPWASARLHITFKTLETGRRLADALRTETAKAVIPGTSSHLSGGVRLPPLVPTADVLRFYELIKRAGDLIGYPVRSERSKGTAESGYTSSVLGVPSVCSMGPEGSNLHSADEYMIPSTFVPRCKLAALAALQAAETFSPAPRVEL